MEGSIEKVAKSSRGSKPGERRGGRAKGIPNKATRELREIAREYTEDALATLAKIMMESESDAARVSAINAILDRGYGKPTQAVEVSGKNGGPIEAITAEMTPVQAAEAYQKMITG